MSRLAWKRLPNGDRLCTTYPILLRKPYGRGAGDVGWLVRVPVDRDPSLDDGWQWSQVYIGDGSGPLSAPSYNDAREMVVEHLDLILGQAADDYDGDALGTQTASAERGERVAQGVREATERHAAVRAANRAEYDRPLSAHEQSLLDGLARLSDMRRQRILDETRRTP